MATRERGQAFAEYMVMIPGAVMVAIAAGLVVGFLVDSFTKAVDIFEPVGITCEVNEEPANTSGPTVAYAGPHMIELTANVYDENNDTTTITYTVTSNACDRAISHWMLGLPEDIAENIIEVGWNGKTFDPDGGSDLFEKWLADDPSLAETFYGTKFNEGYPDYSGDAECPKKDKDADTPPSDDETPEEEADGPGNSGNAPGKNKGRSYVTGGLRELVRYDWDITEPILGVSREVTILMSGHYDFGSTAVAVKYATEAAYTYISAPVQVYVPNPECE